MKKYKVHELKIYHAQRGWGIEAFIGVQTRRQYTNENISVSNHGFLLKPSHSFFFSLFKFWKALRDHVAQLQSLSGEYEIFKA